VKAGKSLLMNFLKTSALLLHTPKLVFKQHLKDFIRMLERVKPPFRKVILGSSTPEQERH